MREPVLLLYAALLVYLGLLGGSLWTAFSHQDRDARTAGWVVLAGVLATQAAWFIGPRWTAFDPGIMAVDGLMVLGLGAIALRSRRWWPLWMTAAQLAATLTHIAPLAAPHAMIRLYQLSQPAWMFLVLGILLWGAGRRTAPPPMAPPV